MSTNKYPTTCATCGNKTPAGTGRLAGKRNGKWLTNCGPCAAKLAAPMDWSSNAPEDDDGYDAMKDAACENGTWGSRHHQGGRGSYLGR